ncbi:MAG: ORF6N domain-containing protein [Chlorobiaceae bacterium]|nr:ORF6N domain-containing protein [Chlorobiaceae bacterium]
MLKWVSVVLLDSTVAEIYGVEVKRINEAVKNNPEKFPAGYVIELEKTDWDLLKSKFSTSIKGGKVKLPSAFTEKGLYMLATILKSPQATQVTISIVETFSKIRGLSRSIKQLAVTQDKEFCSPEV